MFAAQKDAANEGADRKRPSLSIFHRKGWCRENIHVLYCCLRSGRSRETGFVDQHRPGIKSGRGARNATHRSTYTINGQPGLWAMNIDPVQAAAEYRERIVGPYRGVLPDEAVQSIEEQLSGACTLRSRPSMNSRGSSAMTKPPGTTTMLSSIQRPRATP